MSKLLIYKYIDINNSTNYTTISNTIQNRYSGICPNFGNKLWYQGLISEISVDGNIIDYYHSSMTIDSINEEYYCVIFPMANIFSIEYSKGLKDITSFIRQLKIPIYIISCGLQCATYDEIDNLIDVIGNDSKDFIQAVYNTGGDFALRGYYTAEFFSRLGFKNLKVVGCPSLYQLGKELSISNHKVKFEDFKLGLNGVMEIVRPLMSKYLSIYYDQESLFHYMYNDEYYRDKSLSIINNLKWIKSSGVGIELAEWISNNRIRLLADMWDWEHSLQNEQISFTYGTRIHGTIVSLLSRIPAVIVNVDSRVKEMAEFYDIPNIEYKEAIQLQDNGNDIYHMYVNTDFSVFNKKYIQKFEAFNDFLIECGIVKKSMNSFNPFWDCSTGEYPISATELSKKRAQKIKRQKWIYDLLLKIV